MAEPSPRGAHGFGYMDGKVVVFGGYGPPLDDNALADGGTRPEQPLDDLFFLHLRCIQADTGSVSCGQAMACSYLYRDSDGLPL